MLKYFFIVLMITVGVSVKAQTPLFSDCVGAIQLCAKDSTTYASRVGHGTIEDIPEEWGCMEYGETNSVWFKLNIDSSGYLVFDIIPHGFYDDIDFALFKVDSADCDGIAVPKNMIRCSNRVAQRVPTGLAYGATETSAGLVGDTMLAPVEVEAGEVYYLMVLKWSSDVSSFSIDLREATCAFTDDADAVVIDQAFYDPSYKRVVVTLSEPIIVGSISNDASEFKLTGPDGVIPINTVTYHGHYMHNGMWLSARLYVNLFQSLSRNVMYDLEVVTGTDGDKLLKPCGTDITDASITAYLAGNTIGIEGTDELFAQQVQVYPNPTKDLLYITTELPNGTAWSASLFDLNGKQISTTKVSSQSHRLDVSSLPNGTYLLMCSSALGTYQQKVVVLH